MRIAFDDPSSATNLNERLRIWPEDPAGLQSGQPLLQSVDSLGTAVTGQALNRYNAGLRLENVTAAGFLTPGGFQHLVADRNHDLSGK